MAPEAARPRRETTPERWERIHEIVHAALERGPAERSEYLNQTCADDSELRNQVESLIASSESPGGPSPSSTFLSGRLPSGTRIDHFVILSLLGSGGMGEVYRARDTQLERDVAIKMLPLEFAEDRGRLHRFEQEARSTAALNHPNILAIHQFGQYQGQPYIVSELVDGRTLREEVKNGALPVEKAIGYGMQIVRGLAAAHGRGIIHRDLKPENLIVTHDGQLKILDFGLAKLLGNQEQSTSALTTTATAAGVIVGTIEYMSPEQLCGSAVDGRTDIYAVGAVLYEICTGRRVFEEQSASLIGAILHDAPQPPRMLNRKISGALESILLQCLEKDPDRRYQSAAELMKSLEAAGRRLGSRKELWTAAAALIAILAVGVAVGFNMGGLRARLFEHRQTIGVENESGASTIKARRAVAVLGFRNVSGRADAGWLSTGIAEMLTTELGAGNQIRTVAAENVVRAKKDLAIPDADTLAVDTLAHLRQNLGADYIVLGSYVDLGQGKDAEVRLDLRLQNAHSGETVGLMSEAGKEDELFDLVTKAGSALREKLGIAPMSAAEAREARSLTPANPGASRLYAEGLSQLRNFNPLAARDLFEKVLDEDPNFALAHSALADAWAALGYDAKAAAEAKKALAASANLDREQQLLVEGHYYETDRQWSKAIETYRALWAFAPDNPEYGLRLAYCQAGAGQAREAMNTVDMLHKLPTPIGNDARIDLAEEVAARGYSDFKRALKASLAAKEKGKLSRSQLLVARAQLAQSRSYYSLGELESARRAAEEARQLFAAAGDQSGEAAALHNIATVLSDRGDIATAKQIHQQALATCRELGNQKCVADNLNSIGIILKDQADFEGAEREYRQSLAIRREIGDRSGVAVSLNNIAVVFYQQGQLANARKMYEEALTIAREIGEKRGIARALTNLGIVLQDEGELNRARQVCEESIALRRQIADRQGLGVALNNYAVLLVDKGELQAATKAIDEQLSINQAAGNQRGLAYAWFVKGDILRAEGRLEDARKAHEEALAIREKIGEKTTVEESRVSLAKLKIEQGHADADVEASLREVLAEARKQKEPEIERFAEITLAESLLKLGRPSDATKEIQPAEIAAMTTESRLHRIDVFITAARLHAAFREWQKAEGMLGVAISESRELGCIRCQLEGRLALAQVRLQRGDKKAGTMAATLRKDATERGFLLVAHRASALSP